MSIPLEAPRLVPLHPRAVVTPAPDGDSGAEPRLRATDLDRRTTAAHLEEAVGRGQLTLAEASGRFDQVYTARHRVELDGLVADLPPERTSDPTPPGWAALVMMARLQLRETAHDAARRSRLARAAVRHPRLSAAALLGLLVTLTVLAHLLVGHGHHWHGGRFGDRAYGPAQLPDQ